MQLIINTIYVIRELRYIKHSSFRLFPFNSLLNYTPKSSLNITCRLLYSLDWPVTFKLEMQRTANIILR